jgi:hypothetical protein
VRLEDAHALVASLTDAERAVVEEMARAEALDRMAHPLAYATLWHSPRTSQREAIRTALDQNHRATFILGGNRSGKSRAKAMWVVAMALGGDHPDVIAWCQRNGLDPARIPPGPDEVWSVALDSNDSRNYVRPTDAEYLPVGTKWRNRDGNGEAEARLPNGGKIVYKSVDQGRDGFQGSKPRAIAFDEEPRDLGVVAECEMRLVDKRGRMLFSMTPLYGWTPLLLSRVQTPTPDTAVRWLHGEDNPHIPADELRARLAKYGPHEQAARARGEITALEGRVFPMFDRSVHVVRSFRPPDDWPRYVGIDWGTTVPTAILLAAYDASTDTIHVIDEVYRTEMTIADRARAIREIEAQGPPVDVRWADPEDASTNRTLTLEYDIPLAKAYKAVRYGINVLATRLQPDALGRPHLVFHDRCANTIREIEGYVWSTTRPDEPVKKNDHGVDAGRYLCVGISRVYGLAPPLPTDGEREAA